MNINKLNKTIEKVKEDYNIKTSELITHYLNTAFTIISWTNELCENKKCLNWITCNESCFEINKIFQNIIETIIQDLNNKDSIENLSATWTPILISLNKIYESIK